MERLGFVNGSIIYINILIFSFWNDSFFYSISNYLNLHELLTQILVGITISIIYWYLSKLYIDKIWNEYNSSQINSTFTFTQLIAVPLHHFLVTLLLSFNLLLLYEVLDISLNLYSRLGQVILITLVGLPITVYIYLSDKIHKKVISKVVEEF